MHHLYIGRLRHWLGGLNLLLFERMIFRMNFFRIMFRRRKGLIVCRFWLLLSMIFSSSMLSIMMLNSNSSLVNYSRGSWLRIIFLLFPAKAPGSCEKILHVRNQASERWHIHDWVKVESSTVTKHCHGKIHIEY